ncbi:hypothetical protein PIB30_090641 [Stylosanthes scabra]|uniref:Uncharacterized protein n=1 Tax=Stylosanthes scabra TaxID=79078 RepID=A0ABU6TU10_9FABA|nr:hypothetical protein [Stylosanthes scabra]
MGSSIIYYEYEKREKFEDYDLKADAKLGTFNIRYYHFDDKSFIHPLHSIRFDPDFPYEVPIAALMADQPLSSSPVKESLLLENPIILDGRVQRRIIHREGHRQPIDSLHRRVVGKTLRPPKSWELIPPSKGWMCEGDKGE